MSVSVAKRWFVPHPTVPVWSWASSYPNPEPWKILRPLTRALTVKRCWTKLFNLPESRAIVGLTATAPLSSNWTTPSVAEVGLLTIITRLTILELKPRSCFWTRWRPAATAGTTNWSLSMQFILVDAIPAIISLIIAGSDILSTTRRGRTLVKAVTAVPLFLVCCWRISFKSLENWTTRRRFEKIAVGNTLNVSSSLKNSVIGKYPREHSNSLVPGWPLCVERSAVPITSWSSALAIPTCIKAAALQGAIFLEKASALSLFNPRKASQEPAWSNWAITSPPFKRRIEETKPATPARLL